MQTPIINWQSWNDAECKEAWKALKQNYRPIELMYAFYGGLLSGDIEFSGAMTGIKKHSQNFGSVDFSFKKADEAEESSIRFFPKVPVSALKEIVQNHTFNEKEKRDHAGLFSDDEISHVHTEFGLLCNRD